MKKPKIKHGEVLGTIPVGPALASEAMKKSAHYFQEQVESEFMEMADTCTPGQEFDLDWIPAEELAQLGYTAIKKNHHWIMSTGTGVHIDKIWGNTLMWVLRNDDLFFKQGRVKLVHQPGEWFIFNDNLPHQADVTKSSPECAVFFGWAVQLEKI